jgi:hypothetical protein
LKKCFHRICKIEWIDADEKSGWLEYGSKEESESPWVIYTIGYLVTIPKTKKGFYVLANSHLPDTNQWSGITRIPKGMVLSFETLMSRVPCGKLLDENSSNT